MKKIAVLLFTAAVLISGTAASDIGFFCDGIEQHPEILWGFLPTYISGGMDYTGVSLLEDVSALDTLREDSGRFRTVRRMIDTTRSPGQRSRR